MDISQLEIEVQRLWEICQAKREEATAATSVWHEAYRRLEEAKREQLVEQKVAERTAAMLRERPDVDEALSVRLAQEPK